MLARHLVLTPGRSLRSDRARRIEPIELLRSSLGSTYEIEHEIGQGGMGKVYLARDLRHDRAVAIKVLHPEIARALGPDRFLQEIDIAATFLHPNIMPLYDSGSVDGLLYYVMPYVVGESLRAKLAREGQLRMEDVIRVTGDVASALDYAHGRGVVHRDVKPENILLTSDRALLTDFGLATNITGAGDRRTTLSGFVIGTPSYMSPEQGAPGGHVDRRTDVYALGCVVYEMLAGEAPFAGATELAILARHAVDPVPPLRTIRPGIPTELERAVLKALAKCPADRPAEAGQFAAALVVAPRNSRGQPRRPAGGIRRVLPMLGLLLVAVLPFSLEQPARSVPGSIRAPTARPQIAVRAFGNGTGDARLDPLGAFAASWLTWALATSGTVEVLDSAALVTRSSIVAKGRPTGVRPAAPIAPPLLVTGDYYRAGGLIEVHAVVKDLRSGHVVLATDPVLVDPTNPGPGIGQLEKYLVLRISAWSERR